MEKVNKVSLIFFDPKLGITFCNGFAPNAEEMFRIAFSNEPDKLDKEVLAEINKTGTLYYARLGNPQHGIQYQSTLEKLKTELKEIGEL